MMSTPSTQFRISAGQGQLSGCNGVKVSQTDQRSFLPKVLVTYLVTAVVPSLIAGALGLGLFFAHLRDQAVLEQRRLAWSLGKSLEAELRGFSQRVSTVVRLTTFSTNDSLQATLNHMLPSLNGIPQIAVFTKEKQILAHAATESIPSLMLTVDFETPATDGSTYSVGFFTSPSGAPRIFYRMPIDSQRFFLADIELRDWANWLRQSPLLEAPVLVALLPRYKLQGEAIRLYDGGHKDFRPRATWGALTSLQDFRSSDVVGRLSGGSYRLQFLDLPSIVASDGPWARLLVALPESYIYRNWWIALWCMAGGLALIWAAGLFLALRFARNLRTHIAEVAVALQELAAGKLSLLPVQSGNLELEKLKHAFNSMGESFGVTQVRTRVMQKVLLELYNCHNHDVLMRKAVEMICTQCKADVAWFLPAGSGPGLMWQNRRVIDVPKAEIKSQLNDYSSQYVQHFNLKNGSAHFGDLAAIYGQSPGEVVESTLHAVVALIETSLTKTEIMNQAAVSRTNEEFLNRIQIAMAPDQRHIKTNGRLASYQHPSPRLIGEWMHLIDVPASGKLYILIGDMEGDGPLQALGRIALRCAVSAIETLVHRTTAGSGGLLPLEIRSIIGSSVIQIWKDQQIKMSCIIARIDFNTGEVLWCNDGQKMPISVVAGDKLNSVTQFVAPPQGDSTDRSDEGGATECRQESYRLQPNEAVIFHSDFLSTSKHLKPEVFSRILERGLQQSRSIGNAENLCDEILAIVRFYTQDSALDDRFCLAVVQMGLSHHTDFSDNSGSVA